jgi:hypothetical protein
LLALPLDERVGRINAAITDFGPEREPRAPKPVVYGPPSVAFLDLPQLRESVPAHQPLAAVYSVPWPGTRSHGRSDQTWDGNDMDTYADDLAALMDTLDLRNAVMVGHSTGGGEVARYVGRHGPRWCSTARCSCASDGGQDEPELCPGFDINTFEGTAGLFGEGFNEALTQTPFPYRNTGEADAVIRNRDHHGVCPRRELNRDLTTVTPHEGMFRSIGAELVHDQSDGNCLVS